VVTQHLIGLPGRAARQRSDAIEPMSAQRAIQALAGQPGRDQTARRRG
jgi:hypothetical protein